MAEVATELGVAKPTLYRLAGSKDQLVRACVDLEAERLLGHLHAVDMEATSALATMSATLDAMRRFAQDSPGGFRLLFERRGPEAQQAVARVEAGLAALLRRNGQPAERLEIVAAGLLGAASAVVSRTQATR